MHAVMFVVAIVAAIANAGNTSVSNTPWRAGAVCEDVNVTSTSAPNMLSGKHLRILETVWRPFAARDATAPHGWTGMDIDLLDAIAPMLNFTYDIADMGSPAAGRTWTDLLVDVQNDGDLIASYWVTSNERLAKLKMLRGHIDSSIKLIARRDTVDRRRDDSFWGTGSHHA